MKIKKCILLFLGILFFSLYSFGQDKMSFINYLDQAKKPYLTSTHLGSGFNIEIYTDSVTSIKTNNGYVYLDTINTLYSSGNYICRPSKLGQCTIKLEYIKDGKLFEFSKSINVIEKPQVYLKYDKKLFDNKRILDISIHDKKNNDTVTSKYYSSYSPIKIIRNDKMIFQDVENFKLGKALDIIPILKSASTLKEPIKKNDIITITLILFSEDTSLYVDHLEIKIKIE